MRFRVVTTEAGGGGALRSYPVAVALRRKKNRRSPSLKEHPSDGHPQHTGRNTAPINFSPSRREVSNCPLLYWLVLDRFNHGSVHWGTDRNNPNPYAPATPSCQVHSLPSLQIIIDLARSTPLIYRPIVLLADYIVANHGRERC